MTAVAARTSPNLIVIDGQSLNLTPSASPWPTRITADFPGVPRIVNKSVLGTSWTNLSKRAPQEVFPLLTRGQRAVLIVGIGAESDLGDGDSGATIYARLGAYVTAAKAAASGIKVLGLTIPPSTIFSTPQNTARTDANMLILADASHTFDATVDVTVPPLDDPSGPAFAIDGLHLNATGAAAVRTLLVPTLATLLA